MSSQRHSIAAWRTRSILSICALFVVAGVGSIVLTVGAERREMRLEQLRSVARMATAAVEAGNGGGGADAMIEVFRRWSWAAMTDGHVLGAVLFDAEGALIDVQPQDLMDVERMQIAFSRSATTVDCGEPIGNAAFVGRKIPDKASVWVVATLAPPFLPVSPTFGISAAVMFAGLLLSLVQLRRSFDRMIYAPLLAIRQATQVGGERYRLQLPTGRGDEFGEVARNVARIMDDHEIAQSRMGHMERSMDARVADQTKRIQNLLKQAEKRAWSDPLTGLGNRRLLDDRLEELFTTQRNNGEDMSVIMFDLDNFKVLNDTLGHAAGDEVLSFVGELLRCSLRPSDIGLRCGGDEFVAILLDTDAAEAEQTAERLAKLFAQRASLYKVSPPLSLSAGLASIRRHQPENGAGLLALADAALYQAKRAGKGGVRIVNNAPTL